jgi:hypothetical protein
MAKHYTLGNPRWRLFALSVVLGVSLGCVGWFASTAPNPLQAPLLLIGVFWFAVVASACSIYFIVAYRVLAAYGRMPSYWKTIGLKLTGDGMDFEHEIGYSHVNWSALAKIEEDKNLLYFFVNRKSAFPIPKRAFPNADEASAFLNRARGYWAEAQTGA